MEKYVDMASPLTGGRVKEVSTTELKEFRKEKFRVHVRYYVCEDTGEQFTTTEQDTLQFNDLYSQYRIKHGIPFPDEIKEIRLKYGLNYSQISRILGFGANQYAKYEAGEVPSESNGKMITTIKNKTVLVDLLQACKDAFLPSEYKRIMASISQSEMQSDEQSALFSIIFYDNKRTIFNGYGYKNINKLFEMVRYIIRRSGEIFPTKLNKLMFYADFHNYRQTGMSISGLQYRALAYGPVPDHYATIYDNIPGVEKKIVEAHNMVSTLLSCNFQEEYPLLSTIEKQSIDHIVDLLGNLSVKEIIEKSHEEPGWQKCSVAHCHIAFDQAFDLCIS